MNETSKVLQFPLGGVARDMDYRKAYIPSENVAFASPFAVNVIGECTFGGRLRGGSRPGLAAVEGITSASTGHWMWPNGDRIALTGGTFVFNDVASVFTLPDGSKIARQHETFNVSASKGAVPSGLSVMAVYRDRLFVSKDTMWYASRTGDFSDFDYGGDADDATRPAAGNLGDAGREGETITALAPIGDEALVFATNRRIRMLRGEPTAGQFSTVSEHVGMIGRDAWCYDGTTMFFIGTNGMYAFNVGEGFARLVSSRLPEDLKGLTSATLVYDPERRGVHVIANRGETACDWYFDVANSAFWPIEYNANVRPTMGGTAVVGGVNAAVFLCADGVWRMWSDTQKKDGTYVRQTKVAIGPVRTSSRDDIDGMLAELVATLGEGSDDVTIRVYAGKSPEKAVANALDPFSRRFTCTVGAGTSCTIRPRKRGAWVLFVLLSSERWSYESMTALFKNLGRLR